MNVKKLEKLSERKNNSLFSQTENLVMEKDESKPSLTRIHNDKENNNIENNNEDNAMVAANHGSDDKEGLLGRLSRDSNISDECFLNVGSGCNNNNTNSNSAGGNINSTGSDRFSSTPPGNSSASGNEVN